MTRMEVYLDQLQSTNTPDQLAQLVNDFRDSAGIEHAIYHVVGTTGREFGAHTYDPAWVERYVSKRYFEVDPVVLQSLRSFGPLDWRKLDWSASKARNLIGEAVSEGVGKQGLSIPIRGANGQFALFSVTSYDSDGSWDKFLGDYSNDLLLLGYNLHQKAMDFTQGQACVKMPELSPRERDVLTSLAAGRSRSEMAARLSISEHTARVYIDTARHKLGAQNTTHAVAIAITNGLILP